MRRIEIGTRLRVLLGTAAFALLLGCPGQELAPLSPCTVSSVSLRVDQAGNSDVDLLFMIDNSGSMASKQKKLAEQLPRLLNVLTSGDRCAGKESTCTLDDSTSPKRMFTPVKSLHLGVVTSNAGGIDAVPDHSGASIVSCQGNGDDGKLQNSVDIAVNGVIAGNQEFENYKKDDVVIAPAPECGAIGSPELYQAYSADQDNLADTVANFGCVSRVGVRGCPFEQQLESPWKALAPSSGVGADYVFLNDSNGQGDTYNDGFVRDDAVLAIVLITDEDDCAITDAGKVMFIPPGADGYDEANTKYGDLNLRCGFHYDDPELIQPTDRYMRGFQSLKPENTDRVIFAAITGVPPAAIAASATPTEILALPEMVFAENPNKKTFPLPSCQNAAGTEVAYPPIRIVQVARDFGPNGILYSVCEDDYAPALDLLIEKIANKLTGSCLPHPLNPDSSGRVNCQVFEILPKGKTDCAAEFGLAGPFVKRDIKENGVTSTRNLCPMDQVQLDGATPKAGVWGWYYDDFTDDVKMTCATTPWRIAFQFQNGNDLPAGAGATIECFQPVARIDNHARGFDAINTKCTSDGDECSTRSNGKEGGYDLFCLTNTCQIGCKANPDCPAGWVCSTNLKDTTTPKYCQLPTCPPNDSANQDNAPEAGARDAG